MSDNKKSNFRAFYEDWRSRNALDQIAFGLVIFSVFLGTAGVILNFEKLNEQVFNIYLLAFGSVIILFLGIEIGAAYRLYIEQKLKREAAEVEHARALASARAKEKEAEVEHARALASARVKEEEAISLIFEEIHRIAHGKRDIMVTTHDPLELNVSKTVEHLNDVCDSLRNIFERAFHATDGLTVRVAIKGFILPEKVVTIARDRATLQRNDDKQNRDEREEHSIANNSAFEDLFAMKGSFVFVHDNLKEDPSYRNTTSNWHNLYTSCMVVPIVKRSIYDRNVSEIAGFIGVDGFYPGNPLPVFCDSNGQANEAMKKCLLAYADCIFAVVKRGTIISAPAETPSEHKYFVDTDNCHFINQLNYNLCAIQSVKFEHSRRQPHQALPSSDRNPSH